MFFVDKNNESDTFQAFHYQLDYLLECHLFLYVKVFEYDSIASKLGGYMDIANI